MEITIVGIDLAKNILQVHAADAAGLVAVRKTVRQAQVDQSKAALSSPFPSARHGLDLRERFWTPVRRRQELGRVWARTNRTMAVGDRLSASGTSSTTMAPVQRGRRHMISAPSSLSSIGSS